MYPVLAEVLYNFIFDHEQGRQAVQLYYFYEPPLSAKI